MALMQQRKKVVYVNDGFEKENHFREINANFAVPVVVETKLLDWQLSPENVIQQQCFERVGKAKLRLTTLAQFSAERTFKKFGHEGGVEFFVLSGVFSDDRADYVAGSYVRHPAKTYQPSYTREGCTVLFKLGQFQPLDRKRVFINSRDEKAEWLPAGEPGVSRLDLHHFAEEAVCLYRIRAECWITFKGSNQGVEIFVCEGAACVNGAHYETGSWLRYPAGSKLKVSTKSGVCFYLKRSLFPVPL